MRKKGCFVWVLLALFLISIVSPSNSEVVEKNGAKSSYEIVWEHTFGGTEADRALDVIQTSDGGFILGGWTKSFGNGEQDAFLIKLDADGKQVWNQTYGGIDVDNIRSVIQTSDGGYLSVGQTNPLAEAWFIKSDSMGNYVWNQSYGGPGWENLYSVIQTTDGGFIAVGDFNSGGVGKFDVYVVKLNNNGDIEWDKTIGDFESEWANTIVQTEDNGFVIAASTSSYGTGSQDMWLIKTNESGNIEWNQTYGGVEYERNLIMIQTSDKGFFFGGFTRSFGEGGQDGWIIKTDFNGNHEWNQTYGGVSDDWIDTIIQTSDGGYLLGGTTYSFNITALNTGWLIKTNSIGYTEWKQTFDGRIRSMIEVSTNEYVIAGHTEVKGAGDSDFWVFKLKFSDTESDTGVYGFSFFPVFLTIITIIYLRKTNNK